ncbi:hypothetical protein Cni_G01775 [Canna indica]|uniref:Phytocyanin domain-containing protein n=1 Tax=Canna indica TaxID=4628 RepID=A0AAQ3Q239_9LILI|nr:hypothetical protein Cni_G01775 [Canna indica]
MDVVVGVVLWAHLTFTITHAWHRQNHDVLEVKRSDYDSCTVPATPLSSDRSGNTTIALKAAGMRYFICGVVGHCRIGMKLAISVRATSFSSLPPTARLDPALLQWSDPDLIPVGSGA